MFDPSVRLLISQRSLTRLLATVAISFALSLPTSASEATTEIAKYFNAGGRAEFGMRRAIAKIKESNPREATNIAQALSNFNGMEVERRVGLLFDKNLSANDIDAFFRFAETPAGKLYGAAFRGSYDGEGLMQRLNAIQGENRKAIIEFQNGPLFDKVFRIMSSAEAKKMSTDYGEELVCRHLKKNYISEFNKLKSKERCKEAQ